MRFLSGIGSAQVTVPGGQLLDVSVVGDATLGTYVMIGNQSSIFVPPGMAFELGAHELGLCCGADVCDQYPGDRQILVSFGTFAAPVNDRELVGEPQTWLVVYTGCA
jgi:hypothetical protein